jgi:phage-related protein
MKITSNVNLNANVINNSNDIKSRDRKVENSNLSSDVQATNMKVAKDEYKSSIVNDVKDSSEVASKESKTTKSSIGGFFKSVADKFSYVTSEVSKFAKTAVSVGESVIKTVKSVSNIVVDTAKVVSATIKDVSDSVTKKIKDTASQIASTFKQVTTTAADLKKAAGHTRDSAISLIDTGVKTAVSVGENVKEVVEKIGTSVDKIKAEWNNPNNGIINKVVQTGGAIKDGIESIKEPIKEIGNTASTGYNEIKKNYKDIRNNIENSLSCIQEVKNAVVSVSKNVIDTIKTVAAEVKDASKIVVGSISDASANIKNIVKDGYNEINETIQKSYNGHEKDRNNLENNDGMIPVLA